MARIIEGGDGAKVREDVEGAPFARPGWMTGTADAPTMVGGAGIDAAARTTLRAGAPVLQDGSGAPLVGTQVDTDGDGIGDTYAVRVEGVAPHRSWVRALGAWVGKSLVALVLVVSLVAAAAAATSLFHTRQDVRRLQHDLDRSEAATLAANQHTATATGRIRAADQARDAAVAKVAKLARANQELSVEVRGLRALLVDDGVTGSTVAAGGSAAAGTSRAPSTAAGSGASSAPGSAAKGATPAPVVDEAAASAGPGA